MLHWLAGQRAPDGQQNDPDATYIEPPETPAPVFAVRAFKHALFGTPQTQQQPRPAPRRNSNTENTRPQRNGEGARPTRPGMPRPKSASDAQTLSSQSYPPGGTGGGGNVEPLASPTKSILVREGMGTPRDGKKKVVTFGEDVLENEAKRPLKGEVGEDVPGRFPTSPAGMLGEDSSPEEEKGEGRKGRTKLTEALEHARDESRNRRKKGDKKGKRGAEEEESEVPAEFREPKSEVGKYWKREYDIYRANTQREVKKLITKQKAAKSFALSKDIECTELSEQLKDEQRKVEELSTKTAELSAQMREMEEKLQRSSEAEKRQAEEIAVLQRQFGRRDSARPTSSDEPAKNEPPIREPLQSERSRVESTKRTSKDLPNPSAESEPVQRPSEPYRHSPATEKPKLDIQTLRARLKARQEPQPPTHGPKSAEDIWAQSFNSSSPVLTRGPPSPKASRAVTAGTDATPLKTLDVNSLPSMKEEKRVDSVGSMQVECESRPDLDRVDSKNSQHSASESAKGREKDKEQRQRRREEPLHSPSSPLPSTSDLHTAASTATKQEPVPRAPAPAKGSERPDLSLSLSLPLPGLESSPFQSNASSKPQPQPKGSAKPLPARPGHAPSGPRDATTFKTVTQITAVNTKENLRPHAGLHPPAVAEVREKPSVLWSSIGAVTSSAANTSASSTAGRRNTSLTAKDGREVSGERLEAAKARLQARKTSRVEGGAG